MFVVDDEVARILSAAAAWSPGASAAQLQSRPAPNSTAHPIGGDGNPTDPDEIPEPGTLLLVLAGAWLMRSR